MYTGYPRTLQPVDKETWGGGEEKSQGVGLLVKNVTSCSNHSSFFPLFAKKVLVSEGLESNVYFTSLLWGSKSAESTSFFFDCQTHILQYATTDLFLM